MTKLFDYLIARPVAVLLALAALLFGGLYIDARLALATMETRAVTAEASVIRQSDAALAVAAQGVIRAEAAAKAQLAAFEAGKADRSAARVYLSIPTPPTAERCEAASSLVDQAVRENAQ